MCSLWSPGRLTPSLHLPLTDTPAAWGLTSVSESVTSAPANPTVSASRAVAALVACALSVNSKPTPKKDGGGAAAHVASTHARPHCVRVKTRSSTVVSSPVPMVITLCIVSPATNRFDSKGVATPFSLIVPVATIAEPTISGRTT